MAEHIRKRHNVNCMLYHLVCPAKYRRKVFSKAVEQTLEEVCTEFAEAHDLHFVEIGADEDHVHFLIQSVPMMLPKRIAQIVKSITAREVFERVPDVKMKLWGGQFWSDGYFMNTVGKAHTESAVAEYVREQGRDKEYLKIHTDQPRLF